MIAKIVLIYKIVKVKNNVDNRQRFSDIVVVHGGVETSNKML